MLSHIGSHNGVPGTAFSMASRIWPGVSLSPSSTTWALPERKDALLPRLMVVLGQALIEQLQHSLGGADDMVVSQYIFVNLRAVNVNVDDLSLAGKGLRLEGHPVREPAAHSNQQVALITGHIAGLGAVHADHTGGEGVCPREAAAPHDGNGHRGVQLLGKLPELPIRPAPDHAAAQMSRGRCDWATISTSLSMSPRSGSGAFSPWLAAKRRMLLVSRFWVQG